MLSCSESGHDDTYASVSSDIERRVLELERKIATMEPLLENTIQTLGIVNADQLFPREDVYGTHHKDLPPDCRFTHYTPDANHEDPIAESESSTNSGHHSLHQQGKEPEEHLEPEEQTKKTTRNKVVGLMQELNNKESYQMESTMWEAVIFIGTPICGVMDTISLVVLGLMNWALQCLLCAVIHVGFTKPSLMTITEAKRWRETVAHSAAHVDSLFTSLASRVCGDDGSLHISNQQQATLNDIRTYTTGDDRFPHLGFALCTVVILLSVLRFGCELKSCYSFAQALLALDRKSGKTHFQLQMALNNTELKLESISWQKLLFMFCVTGQRAAIATWLLVSGARWLAQTVSVEELVLNAVALNFILDIDELLYRALSPNSLQTLVAQLKPLSQASIFPQEHRALLDFLKIVCSIGLTLMLVFSLLFSSYSNLHDIEKTLCGGNTEFAVGMNNQHFFVLATSTEPFQKQPQMDSVRAFERGAVRELIDKPASGATEAIYVGPNIFQFEVSQTMFETTGTYKGCKDQVDVLRPYLPRLRSLTKVFNASSCKDFQQHCTVPFLRGLRLLCPETCGCDNPYSGLLLDGPSEGCPRDNCRRTDKYKKALSSRKCQDYSVEELQQMPGWASYIKQSMAWYSRGAPQLTAYYQTATEVFLNQGCGGVRILGQNNFSSVNVCGEGLGSSSIRPFCPVTCGCHREMGSSCQDACRYLSNSTF